MRILGWLVMLLISVTGMAQENTSLKYIQRTMGKLEATGKEKNKAPIRILFYGQSITAQAWHKEVMADLKKRYPNALIEFRNPAIGGFQSDLLVQTAEHDIYPWYPDLMIFHVYGKIDKYEEIIRKTRELTTTEIMLQTDHISVSRDYGVDGDARGNEIKQLAEKYHCAVIDVRSQWKNALAEENIPPKFYLKDDVHLNDAGCALMAKIINGGLRYCPSLPADESAGKIITVKLGDSAIKQKENGEIELTFTGNRVTALSSGAGTGEYEIFLDGLRTSECSSQWAMTRPSLGPNIWMPAIRQVSFVQAPVAEKWTLTCLPDSTPDGKNIHFKVEGSVTGLDGEGWSSKDFLSNSGRVAIKANAWNMEKGLKIAKCTLPNKFQITWSAYMPSCKVYVPKGAGTETTLIQGSNNGKHILTLKPKQDNVRDQIAGFNVYAPETAN
ncbi:MAG: hypothetical protein BWY58_00055 [Chloroflexi bacterium ADurb.Bin344]|nr:MAG: hypothetical protein BWY58_00055 [Chloroflexi bacterium ADurb.Bin344]